MVYAILSSSYDKGDILIVHHVVVLDCDVAAYKPAELASEYEMPSVPWEENPVRKRVA